MKKNKGITLVTLVLSIIILIMIAGVTINAVTTTKIGEKARDVKNETEEIIEEQTEKEKEMLKQNTTEFKVQNETESEEE